MPALDYDSAISITRDFFWVGFFDEQAQLHCNPYLLVDGEEAVIFDPGSIPHFPIVMRKVIDVVDPKNISAIVVCHQDPDCCGNLAVVEDVIDRHDLKIVTNQTCLRLVRHYGLRSELYVAQEHDMKLQLKSGRELKFIELPFLHSPGAMATLDLKSKTLVSGDLFGGISNEWSLFAKEGYLEAMAIFHQTFMPSQAILNRGMATVSALEIERILPQHGSVIEGEQVKQAINHLRNLPCGIDLMGD